MRERSHDVVVIGGGPVGRRAAGTLVRSQRSVVLVDAGRPREAPAVHPLDGATVLPDRAVQVRRTAVGVEVDLAGGTTLRGRRVLLATGVLPDLPAVPGVRESWGRGVRAGAHHLGPELRGRRIGVLGTGPDSVPQTLQARRLSPDVTLFLHTLPEPEDADWERLAALGVRVVAGTVAALLGAGASDGDVQAVVLADGHEFAVDAVVATAPSTARGELFTRLGGRLEERPRGSVVPTDARGATPVASVWAAGSVTDLAVAVSASTGGGVLVGLALAADLALEDADAAVRARRGPSTAHAFSAAMEARVAEVVLGDRRHGLG